MKDQERQAFRDNMRYLARKRVIKRKVTNAIITATLGIIATSLIGVSLYYIGFGLIGLLSSLPEVWLVALVWAIVISIAFGFAKFIRKSKEKDKN